MKHAVSRLFAVTAALCLAACGTADDGGDESDEDAGGIGQVGDVGVSQSDPNSPYIQSLETSVTMIAEGQSVTFSVVLTDPDGVDDIAGGDLTDTAGSSYGAFVADAAQAWSLALSWEAIDEANPIANTSVRTFIVTFYDRADHTVTAPIDLEFFCVGSADCESGICTDLASDAQHCGACGVVCASSCIEGLCACTSDADCADNEWCALGVCEPRDPEADPCEIDTDEDGQLDHLVPLDGECDGNTLMYCDLDTVVMEDCGAAGRTCIDQDIYGAACAVSEGGDCLRFDPAEGGLVLSACLGEAPGCVVTTADYTGLQFACATGGECVDGVGGCSEGDSACVDDYLIFDCPQGQPLLWDCAGDGGSCASDGASRCVGLSAGSVCFTGQFECEEGLVCDGESVTNYGVCS